MRSFELNWSCGCCTNEFVLEPVSTGHRHINRNQLVTEHWAAETRPRDNIDKTASRLTMTSLPAACLFIIKSHTQEINASQMAYWSNERGGLLVSGFCLLIQVSNLIRALCVCWWGYHGSNWLNGQTVAGCHGRFADEFHSFMFAEWNRNVN